MLDYVAGVFAVEANAATDNPLVFENGDVLSGGNFHAEPIAIAADALAIAIAEMGALSERRIALLIDSSLSELPPFLTEHGGVNSGFMIAHVTAASLASENKSLAHPASVDSLPTSANQEDFVSMATFAARRLGAMNTNTRHILAIELLAAADRSWATAAGHGVFGPRVRWRAMLSDLRAGGLAIEPQRRRTRDAVLTVPWSTVAPT